MRSHDKQRFRFSGVPRLMAVVLTGGLLSSVLVAPALADSASERVQQANEMMAAGKPGDALPLYDAAITALPTGTPPSARLVFNRGCAHSAIGNLDAAEADLGAALEQAQNDSLRSAAAYNLGLIHASRAEQAAKDKPEAAIAELRKAERLFRTGFALSPADAGAARNVEVTQRRLAELEDRLRKQKEQEKKDQQSQSGKDGKKGEQQKKAGDQKGQPNDQQQNQQQSGSPSERLDQLAKEQDQQSKKSQEQAGKQAEQSPADRQETNQRQAKDQESLRDETKNASSQLRDMAEQQQDEKTRDELKAAADKLDKTQADQKKAEEDLTAGKPEDASKSQDGAAKKLREATANAKAAEQALAQQKQDEQQKGKEQEAKEAKPDPASDKQNGEPQRAFNATAAQILDREKQIRDQIDKYLRAMRTRTAPVEKDW